MKGSMLRATCALVFLGAAVRAGAGGPEFPMMQAVPLPGDAVSFQRDGTEVAAVRFGAGLRRPFIFPIAGPSGRWLTRMGHPGDPEGHRHHNSVWISHKDVNGVSFWEDAGQGRIVHRRIERFEDGPRESAMVSLNAWEDGGGKVLVEERRRVAVRALAGGETMLVLEVELAASHGPVTFGATPFGLIGVRMAKTLGVKDGAGRIQNSEGGINEEGTFRKPARWVDYAGRSAPGCVEGIALMDHPGNPGHPAAFHTRDDGWMGACLSKDAPVSVPSGGTLRVRYGLYIHAGGCDPGKIDALWREFAEEAVGRSPEDP
ncbi:MAG: PmoA family protein [Verrucomicrobiae bacterium]|nr:PmoA family protein [Verrucomicrobiae bacterium]